MKVYIITDDCGAIIKIFKSKERAYELYEELMKETPRTSFYYEVREYPVEE